MEQSKYLTVTALNNYLKYRFDNDEFLQNILLEGQITSFKAHSSGHLYFALKDDYTQINCIMFQRDASTLNFVPKNGVKVYLRGRVSTYPVSGTYQIYVSRMKDAGLGELFLQFEKLKKELNQKGYFSIEHKKPIPRFCQTIAVITSPTGAVIRDIIKTINHRYNNLQIIVYPTKVQGEGAANLIARQINRVNQDALADVIILARGGGSMEDLWPFNEEVVANAIYQSKIPLISAVGHETDFTISDYVSDMRSPTPTAAGTFVTPERESLYREVSSLKQILTKSYKQKLDDLTLRIMHLETRVKNALPTNKITKQKANLFNLNKQLKLLFSKRLEECKNKLALLDLKLHKVNVNKEITNRFEYVKKLNNDLILKYNSLYNLKRQKYLLLSSKLDSLNPLNIMSKGFSIASINDKYIKTIKDVKINDIIETNVKDGKIISKVVEVKNA